MAKTTTQPSTDHASKPSSLTTNQAIIKGNQVLPISTKNGQRIVGPPSDWTGPSPAKGSEVFIGKLPHDATETELLPFLEKAGPVYQLRLMIDYRAANRGYAFVTFADPATARRAVKKLDQSPLRKHKPVAVVLSIDNRRLFLGGIPDTASAEDIFREVASRVKNVTDVIVYPCPEDRDRNRKFAFVEFEDHLSAAVARKELQQEDHPRLFEGMAEGRNRVQVDWASPEPPVDFQQMATVTNLFVRNVSPNISEADLAAVFSLQGTLKVVRCRRPSTFAFVHFASREEAETAMQELQGVEVDGFCLRIEWAKPPPAQNGLANQDGERYRSRPSRLSRRAEHSAPRGAPAASTVAPPIAPTEPPEQQSLMVFPSGHVAYPPPYVVPPQVPIPFGAQQMTEGTTSTCCPPGQMVDSPTPALSSSLGSVLFSVPLPIPMEIHSAPQTPIEPLREDQSYEAEAQELAVRLYGVRPAFLAYTLPLNNGQKCFYPVVRLGSLTETIGMFYTERQEAMHAAAVHCFAKLQISLRMRATEG